MTAILQYSGAFFLVVGVFLVGVAVLGVLRFQDTLQRMHASTKAGTLGSGFVVVGAMLIRAESAMTVVGSLTLLFLLLTVPIAAHLLGRAAYVSGADLSGVEERDELQGVLEREERSLEARAWSEPD